MAQNDEPLLIAPEVDENLSPEERLKLDKTLEKEITRTQRKYLKLADTVPALKDVQIMRRLEKKLKHLQRENGAIETRLQVAYAPCHVKRYDQQIKQVEDDVRVMEELDLRIDAILTEIRHLQSQMKRLDRERKELQKISQSDYFYYTRVAKAKQRLATLENRLYTMKKKEATQIATNRKLRKTIEDMLGARRLFHKHWRAMIDHLSYDKKFLIDMIERTILAFNQGEELCHKIDALRSHAAREDKAQRQEMLELQRKLNNDWKNHEFLRVKGFHRDMADLDPREIRRRNKLKAEYSRKLELYNRIIEKTKAFCGIEDLSELIEKYQKQEDSFFAYFNYLNELNYQFEQLNCALAQLTAGVDDLEEDKLLRQEQYEKNIKELHEQLLDETKKTHLMQKSLDAKKSLLQSYMEEIDEILQTVGYDRSDVLNLLGDYRKVTKHNVKRFMAALEDRLNTILATVYVSPETRDNPLVKRPITAEPQEIVGIEQIVTTQQCAECAEGQDVNKYDEEIVLPREKHEIKEGVRKKVQAPEMQYRLHNLSKCKLPRSRILVNKRYQ
ncbi:uncharacterized protein LOC129764979 [Toxorhynchites rutilus septentrionalis]|uniref:uncharacterized protein LOC129764979 n=1 Tax=Toxorhynchites rutilus septentrionalis TaxID=329112 RepID=UPI002478FF59|nr:uncharacterized protein LOC129764979 [Toxorhynchites rutilus septentrionalis]